jgi:hypothetical protein
MAEILSVGNVEKQALNYSCSGGNLNPAKIDAAGCYYDSPCMKPDRKPTPLVRLLILVVISAVPAVGQATYADAHSSPSYLFRIEHIRSDDDVCALVRGDGQFHYERNRGDKATILEGDLPTAVLGQLIRIVSGDELFRLRQENIPQPLIVSRDFDELLLSVLRPGQWQNLRFQTPETRQPFENSLDPLMRWLDSVAREKHRQLEEFAGKNNCQPPGEITLKTRPGKTPADASGPSTPSSSPVPPPLNYLLRSVENQSSDNLVERTCFLLYDTSRYHMEKSSQQYGKRDVRTLIIEGSLEPPDFKKLESMLDSTEWKDNVYQEPPTGMPVRSGTIAFFFIPRGDKVQKLTFWNFVGPGRSLRTNAPPVSANHPDLLQNYENWLQFSVDTINAKPLPVTATNDCTVQP